MARAKEIKLTKEQLVLVDKFIFDYSKRYNFTKEQYWESYQQWGKGSSIVWYSLQQGGTGQMRTLMWYHHVYKPGSKEHRARIIIKALLQEVEKLREELLELPYDN